jgi:hypothetical protein
MNSGPLKFIQNEVLGSSYGGKLNRKKEREKITFARAQIDERVQPCFSGSNRTRFEKFPRKHFRCELQTISPKEDSE